MKTIFIFLFTVAVLWGVALGAKYYTSNGVTYFVSYPMQYNWYEADRFCTFNAMYPVSIHTYEDDQRILAVIQEFRVQFNLTAAALHFWTGGTDLGQTINEFYWTTTGYPLIYKNWIPGLPVNGDFNRSYNSTKDCLLLNGGYNHQWFDEYCTIRYPFICQDKLTMPKRFSDVQCEL